MKERVTERKRKKEILPTGSPRLAQRETRNQNLLPGLPTWDAECSGLGPSAFPGTSAGSWIGSGAARCAGVHMECWPQSFATMQAPI